MGRSFAVVLQLAACAPYVALADGVEAVDPSRDDVEIRGHVLDAETREPITGALILVQCDCLAGRREVMTTDGRYHFRGLRPGRYTVQMLHGNNNVQKRLEAKPGHRWHVGFSAAPRPRYGCH
ncbi:carboxypeptidase-like regulatory domain-containing protein [Nannocystis sp. ILAH1]|uniref:carboxypeptidase-like regulatory domain-containing protein n=1 Tax=unclassified Nannocystis TaxID=2627009 RepID=UPI002270FB65|nr:MULTISPECIES: carboxypeptidase-like regulatory domain-containing protein [unclassified Nannocystis]MCY0990587.1 carboxypeptidase-like regulatory domain-containing protein [Nannocystis sp. ILAH1]MCY1072158.1 carboxypeptidase-like regulatory domain-containing protein [Nannocystis sp. RBIL2]